MKFKNYLFVVVCLYVGGSFPAKRSPEVYNYGAQQNPTDKSLRKHSLPFISSDTFRFFADHTYDECGDLNTDHVKKGETIYVSGWFLQSFFEDKHPKIKEKYILISSNSDIDIDEYFLPFLEDSNLHYFLSTNTIIKHPKLITIPIGIANSFWSHGKTDTINAAIGKYNSHNKSFLLSSCFDCRTNRKIRLPIFNFFANKSFCKTFINAEGTPRYDYATYLSFLGSSYFTLSPFGNGLDCYRVWEACLLGCIPIVQSSPLDHLYKDLPILIVDSFFDIDESFLNNQLSEIERNIVLNKYNMQKLYFFYWQQKIKFLQLDIC